MLLSNKVFAQIQQSSTLDLLNDGENDPFGTSSYDDSALGGSMINRLSFTNRKDICR